MDKYEKIIKALGPDRVKRDVPMREWTTFRLGGPADLFFVANTAQEMSQSLQLANETDVPVFVLGAGADVLFADEGFRGMVVKSGMTDIEIIGRTEPVKTDLDKVRRESRRDQEHHFREGLLKMADLDVEEAPRDTLVRVGSGVNLPHFIRWSLNQGLTGLELFSGIPATIGGGIYNNIHGGTRLLNNLVTEVELVTKDLTVKTVPVDYLESEYDWTILHETGEIVTSAKFLLSSTGDVSRANEVSQEWKERKLKVQPQTNTAGCVFKNISPEDQKRLGWPTNSVGYLFDACLDWKGVKTVGGAMISDRHANFIVQDKGASQDVVNLMREMKRVAKEKFDLDLVSELIFVGFEGDPLA